MVDWGRRIGLFDNDVRVMRDRLPFPARERKEIKLLSGNFQKSMCNCTLRKLLIILKRCTTLGKSFSH